MQVGRDGEGTTALLEMAVSGFVDKHSGWHWREPCAISVRVLILDDPFSALDRKTGGRGLRQSAEV